MPQDYIRCHYISEESIECASWFPRGEGNLCIVHRGMVSLKGAANGHNKPETISAMKQFESEFRVTYENAKTNEEKCSILDAHLESIYKVIEIEKTKANVVRALRGEVIDGMSAEEIQIRRRMKVPKSDAEPKKRASSGKLIGTNENKIAKLMAKHPGMTEAGARMLLGLD